MTHRFPLILLPLGAAALLGGCASPRPVDGSWHHGTWIVTDAFASRAVSDAASAPRGQAVPMDAARAGDAAGRVCPSPRYGEERAPLNTVIGAAAPAGAGLDETVAVLAVECAGQPFARYAVMGDGALLTRYGGWVLRLEHGEKLAANPAPMMAEPAAPPMALAAALPPPAPPPAPAPAAAPAAGAPRKLVYLASYKTEDWARKGWGILAGRSSTLKASEPVMKSVELKGKGKFVRLFAGARDDGAAKAICTELGKTIAECGVAGRD
ncbi:hypothetical protein H261_06986 [Paramagnetospirillum caucaseum]|uniref:SPOR domain-containing protein n=1 Tax=Paramagnetospirillum caucaseum TaxID=1244869 RepID=M2YCB7_9PROT|nr:hypothetical protein [Paramagnetospirillum caucaseum]EME70631.1 hypothetical protein H261_06986 [Paramagnetospirillum caucaseum]